MILSIDPGNTETAYALIGEDYFPIEKGKVLNNVFIYEILPRVLKQSKYVAIEMIASYGMAVGMTVFETCVWIGRFSQKALDDNAKVYYVYRKEVKINLCGSTKAKDTNITAALVDRFSYPQHKDKGGKGTTKDQGWFYGFSKDVWAAYAVGVTFKDTIQKDLEF